MLGSEVFGSEPGYLGEFREHLWADFLAVMEGEPNLWPARADKCSVASLLALYRPANAKESRENPLGPGGGPLAHAATKDTFRSLADA